MVRRTQYSGPRKPSWPLQTVLQPPTARLQDDQQQVRLGVMSGLVVCSSASPDDLDGLLKKVSHLMKSSRAGE